jgi:hypothetical protein
LISENPYKSVFIRVLFLYYFLLIVPKWHFLTITIRDYLCFKNHYLNVYRICPISPGWRSTFIQRDCGLLRET